jgi:phosphohistidine swiveling domain-containing protein
VQIEHALSGAIKKQLSSHFHDQKDLNSAFVNLLYCPEPTVGVEEKRTFLRFVLKRIEKNATNDKDDLMTDLKDYCESHKYLHAAYGTRPYNLEYYVKRYNKFKDIGKKGIKKIMEQMESMHAKNIARRNQLLEEISDDYVLTNNVVLLTEVGHLRDQNKALLGATIKIRENILDEISVRTNVKRELLNYYFLQELCTLLKSRIEVKKKIIEARKEGMLISRSETVSLNVDSFNEDTEVDINNIKGTCASSGCIEGNVFIINSSKDIDKMKPGNIMVAHGTDFDLINAMQIAGGIVTEEGGLLSHASVISRELGIPCLIGVKKATNIFSDGIRIKLDCDKEMIELIK